MKNTCENDCHMSQKTDIKFYAPNDGSYAKGIFV